MSDPLAEFRNGDGSVSRRKVGISLSSRTKRRLGTKKWGSRLKSPRLQVTEFIHQLLKQRPNVKVSR